MADYYPLVSRAVAGLEKNDHESRQALYERARSALVAQLRSMTPAVSESDIEREQLALEGAIRRVEAEYASRAANPSDIAGATIEPIRPMPRLFPESMSGLEDSRIAASMSAHTPNQMIPEFGETDDSLHTDHDVLFQNDFGPTSESCVPPPATQPPTARVRPVEQEAGAMVPRGPRMEMREQPSLVPRHGDYDWLILSQSRIGKSSGATRIWMLLATPG
jgi:hypothetical protein